MNAPPVLPAKDGAPMDPNLFALKWDQVFEVLLMIVLFAFLLERALSLLFESRWFLKIDERRKASDQGTYKPLIAFLVAAVGCIIWEFDAPSIILTKQSVSLLGAVLTGAVIAGGSKASLALFHDVMHVHSTAFKEIKLEGRAIRETKEKTSTEIKSSSGTTEVRQEKRETEIRTDAAPDTKTGRETRTETTVTDPTKKRDQ